MKLILPPTLSIVPTAFTQSGRHYLTISVFAGFLFAETGPSIPMEAPVMWEALPKVLGSKGIFDAGRPKPGAEFLVYGSCHSPTPSQTCRVGVRFGGQMKDMMVFGDRYWKRDAPEAPACFTSMPLSWEYAYGGPGFGKNPVGKGIDKDATGRIPIPNLIVPLDLPVSCGKEMLPAGFGAIPVSWGQRTRHLGTFDSHWFQKEFPHLPEGTHPLFYMTAPEDQWLSRWICGDEAFAFLHMNSKRSRIYADLPGLRARVFVSGPDNMFETFREVQAPADTVWLFPELEMGILCYRASLPVQDEDADDVLVVLADVEPLKSDPLPLSHYLAQMKQEIQPSQVADVAIEPEMAAGALKSVPEPAISPKEDSPPSPEMPAAEPSPASRELADDVAQLQAESREMLAKLGYTEAEAMELMVKHTANTQATVNAMSEAEIDTLLTESRSRAEKILADHGMSLEQAIQRFEGPEPEFKPLAASDIQNLLENGKITAEQAGHLKEGHEAFAALLALMAQVPDMIQPKEKKQPEPEPSPVEDRPQPADIPPQTDFTGRDFSGQHLANADFTNTVLEKAIFDQADLQNADFTGAVLTGASFKSAKLTGAVLARVTASEADFRDADLTRANLSGSDFTGSRFENANLSDADCSQSIFESAKMADVTAPGMRSTRANFSGADLSNAQLDRADLSDAVMDDARLTGANMRQVQAVNASFNGANCRHAILSDANLRSSRADNRTSFQDCDMQRVTADEAQWAGADFYRTNLTHARISHADISRSNLCEAILTRCIARNTVFSKSVLDRADMRKIDLMSGSLHNASLRGTRLDESNCFGVDFGLAALAGVVLDRANLKRTRFDLEQIDAMK